MLSNSTKLTWTSTFFGEMTTFTTTAASGTSVLTLSGPNSCSGRFANAECTAIVGLISDGENATVAVEKDDVGSWAVGHSQNSYGGGTTVRSGTLNVVNGMNESGPFFPLGTGDITLYGGTVAFRSSKSGTFGPDNGYTLNVNAPARISSGNSQTFTGIGLANGIFRLGHLNLSAPLTVTCQDGLVFAFNAGKTTTLSANAELDISKGIGYQGEAEVLIGGTITDNGHAHSLTKKGEGILRLAGNNIFSGGMTVMTGVVDVTSSDSALGQGTTIIEAGAGLSISKANFQPPAPVVQMPNSIERWRSALARLGDSNSATASCSLAEGVHLQVGTDLNNLLNKTIVLNGGSIESWRLKSDDNTNRHLGAGINIVLNADSFIGQTGNLPAAGASNLKNLMIYGSISETGRSRRLTKIGQDTVELHGVNSWTGGTDIRCGRLRIGPAGTLGFGNIVVSGNNSSNTDTVLEITSSNSIDANSELHLISADSKLGIVDLNFDDIVRVARFTVDGRGRAAGVWAAQAGDGVDHVDELVLQGTGRLEVLPSVTLLKIN